MKLKRLFILRHGPYEGRGSLTTKGREQIGRLGQKLRAAHGLNPSGTIVICSSELRTLKTAQELMISLSTDPIERTTEICHKELFSNESICDYRSALELVKKYGEETENLIVVTHYEMVEKLTLSFGSFLEEYFHIYNVEYGEGWFIDCDKKTFEFIS